MNLIINIKSTYRFVDLDISVDVCVGNSTQYRCVSPEKYQAYTYTLGFNLLQYSLLV